MAERDATWRCPSRQLPAPTPQGTFDETRLCADAAAARRYFNVTVSDHEDRPHAGLHDPRQGPPPRCRRHRHRRRADRLGRVLQPRARQGAAAACSTTCSSSSAGHDPRRIEYLVQFLLQQSRFPPGALGLAAISAIDHCLWDISAKALGVPVYMLLGGHARDRVRVYAGVYTAPDPGHRARRARPAERAMGAHRLQAQPLSDRHARAIAGARWCAPAPNISASCARRCVPTTRSPSTPMPRSSSRRQAMQLGNALAPYDPLFFEEPIRPENFEAWGELKRGLALHAGDGRVALQPLRIPAPAVQVKGCDIIQPDICVVGGLLEMRKIAAHRGSALRHGRAAQPDGSAWRPP